MAPANSPLGLNHTTSPAVVGRDVHVAVRAYGHAVGVEDVPAAGAGAVGGEGLDLRAAGVRHVHRAVRPDRQAARRDQLGLPGRQLGAVEPVAQDRPLRRVGDQHRVAGDGDAVRIVRAIGRERRARGVGPAHPARLGDQVAAARDDSHAARVGGGEAAGEGVVVGEPHDAVALAVGDDDRAVSGRRDRLDLRTEIGAPAREQRRPVAVPERGHGDSDRHRHGESQPRTESANARSMTATTLSYS